MRRCEEQRRRRHHRRRPAAEQYLLSRASAVVGPVSDARACVANKLRVGQTTQTTPATTRCDTIANSTRKRARARTHSSQTEHAQNMWHLLKFRDESICGVLKSVCFRFGSRTGASSRNCTQRTRSESRSSSAPHSIDYARTVPAFGLASERASARVCGSSFQEYIMYAKRVFPVAKCYRVHTFRAMRRCERV